MMKRKKLGIGIAVLILMLLFCGCAKDAQIILTTGFDDQEVFRIEGLSCYTPEVMVYLTNIQNQYEQAFGTKIWDTTIDGISIEENVKQTVLARLAKIKMMNLLAANYKLTLDDEEESKAKQAADEYYASLTQEEIAAMGNVDYDTILQLYREYALANKVYQYLIADVNPEISDDEARTIVVKQIALYTCYTDENGESISYSTEEIAEIGDKAHSILERLSNGEDFDSLAMDYNEAEEAAISFRKGEMPSEIENAAFNLGEGEMSDVIQTSSGYYILMCVSSFDRNETEATKLEIVDERRKEVFNTVYDYFIADKRCYLNEELWNSLTFAHDGSVSTCDFFDVYSKYFNNDEVVSTQ